uniref:F-box/LRR-repeat protein 15/At3g58940/PEG3-like LRR domain-containing protein n=1 Tax=Aegilops tauschii subsp. strangulata TaxID=200361 RepID=A0A453T763_AEGTS
TTRANSLLRAAARLEPEELVFDLPSDLIDGSLVVDLPCLRRATFIALRIFLLILRVPDGAEFPALESLSLSCGIAHAHLDALLRHCPRLRTLRLGGFLFDQGDLRVNSASLQELAVDRESGLTHRVDIVAPALKQLSMSLIATEVSISVLAPMVEKVSWHCCYRAGSITFGLWELEQVTLETSESQGQLPSLQIHASIFRSNFPGGAISFTQEIAKHMVVAFSALELHLKTAGHVFRAIVFLLLGMNRIRPAVRRLKLVLWRTTVILSSDYVSQ